VIWDPARSASLRGIEQASIAPMAVEPQPEPVTTTPAWVPAPASTASSNLANASEEPQENLASRLSGLRSLLFVLGVKESKAEDQAPDRTRPERAVASQAPPAAGWPAQGASPRLVTAVPEVLPPRPIVIDVDKLDETKGQSPTRQDRRASFDGIEILPSKRGQYKKV
jgi:hypothetical protein